MNTTTAPKLRPASVGSVSHGTLRLVDLLDSLGRELEWQIQRNGAWFSLPGSFSERDRLNAIVGEWQDLYCEDGETLKDEGDAEMFLNEELFEALNEFAPPYCMFGALPGDGSDFGYWPQWDAIDELPSKADADVGEDYKEVNDHGNVTVFSAGGQVVAEFV